MTPGIAPGLDLRPGERSEASRMLGILTSPAGTLAEIVQRPAFLAPLLVITLSAFAFTAAILPPGKESAANALWMIAGTGAGVTLRVVAAAAILTVIVAHVSSTPPKFQQTLAIVAYSMMPGVAAALLAAALLRLQASAGVTAPHPLALNLAALLDPHSVSRFFYTLAQSLDAIRIWELALIAQGLKIATDRLRLGAAWLVVLLPWTIYIVGSAAFAAQEFAR